MKIRVTEGYVGFNRKAYGVGTILDLEGQDAAYLIKEGVAVEAPKEAQADVADESAEAPTDDEMTLPDVDPATAVKPGSKK